MKEYNGKRFYNQTETAAAFQCSRMTIRAKIKNGTIPAVRVLGALMIPEDFVKQALNGNFELANGGVLKAWHGKRQRVTKTSQEAQARAERVAAKNASKVEK